MAIDANILLRGIVPDLNRSVGQAVAIGQRIRQAPLRNQLLEQQAQSGQQELGQRSSIAINSIIGDLTEEQITPEIFANSARALQDLGLNLSPKDLQFNPQNVNKLATLSQAGKRFAQQRRGGGQTGFQTNAPIITEDASGQKFFTSLQTDRATGEQRATSVPISGAITDRLGLSAGDRVTQTQQEAIAKASGTVIGKVGAEAETAEQAAETAGKIKGAEERAKLAAGASMAERTAATAELIALKQGLGRERAKSLANDIEKGAVAADSLATINRALDLLQDVETGGLENFKLRAKQAFGIEGADEAELNNLLQVAVLQQLKPTFGAAFTANEADTLLRISQGFGKNTETNIRLLLRMKKIAERASQRGIESAFEAGDIKRSRRIGDAASFRFTFGDAEPSAAIQAGSTAAPTTPVAQPATQAVQQDPTVTTQAEFDAIPSGSFFIEDGVRQRKL